MSEEGLGLFAHGMKDKPDYVEAWSIYEKGRQFNTQIGLYETVKNNENFYVGRQWEGVVSNGLPTPIFNFLKRTVMYIVSVISTEKVKANASILANTVGTKDLQQLANVVNDEFEALAERNDLSHIVRKMARDAAVRGDGCVYVYWDNDLPTGQTAKGGIKFETLKNTDVLFGNPNITDVNKQPWIMISTREMIRDVRRKAKENGIKDWQSITVDSDDTDKIDSVKMTTDKVTDNLLLWRDDDTGTIWAYESTQTSSVKEPWDLGIENYPLVWLNWDEVEDCYHGQAMITGLIPNQEYVNKMWAMLMISSMKTAFPKYVYDKTKVKGIDNRVGSAIGIVGGDVNGVIKVIDPPPISPQISQILELAVNNTQANLGATSVALGDTRPDNTSAIVALTRAAQTPSEMTKQNLYEAVEQLFRISLDFMSEYYGKRYVDVPTPARIRDAVQFAQMANPDLEIPESIPELFDFSSLKDHEVMIKLDVGASTFYSEVQSTTTLSNLFQSGAISKKQLFERMPDNVIPGRSELVSAAEDEERQQKMQMQMAAQAAGQPPMGGPAIAQQESNNPADVPVGKGYSNLQRKINGEEE